MNRLRRDDRGQITTALVMVGVVVIVALGLAAAKLGQATDEKSRVQIAADAAALAGAQQIRNDLPQLIVAAIGDGGGGTFRCGMGQAQASDFANRAGAQVVQYCYYPSRDTVQVSVESLTNSVAGTPARAKAESRVGLALGACVLPPQTQPPATSPPAPTPTLTAGSPPTTQPPPPPDVEADVRCGDVVIPVVVLGVSGRIRIGMSADEIGDLFTPALKS